jgi:hypothetical protein
MHRAKNFFRQAAAHGAADRGYKSIQFMFALGLAMGVARVTLTRETLGG